MKKLKVKVGVEFFERVGYVEGPCETYNGIEGVLIYFPDKKSLEIHHLTKVTVIGYEEV